MLLTWLSLAVMVLSMVGLAVIIGRKFPILAKLDTSSAVSPHDERKRSLLEERLKRKVSSAWSTISTVAGPVGAQTGKLWEKTHQKLVELEHEYKIRSLPVLLNRRQRHKVDQEVADILAQARALLDDGEIAAAEEKCLQAIRLELRSVPAFELLGQIYVQANEHGHAKEVYQYLLKLTGESDAIYEHLSEVDRAEGHLPEAADELRHAIDLNRSVATYHLELSQVYRAMGQGMRAFLSAQEASRLEPNNPKVLDELIEASILARKKQFALDAVGKLAEVNPSNGKIGPWREQIAAIPDKSMLAEMTDDETAPSLYDTHTSPNERS